MARGTSGRIVVEIDPEEKRELYGALIQDGFTLKDWFLQQSARYLRNRNQVPLFVPAAEADQGVLPPIENGEFGEAAAPPQVQEHPSAGIGHELHRERNQAEAPWWLLHTP